MLPAASFRLLLALTAAPLGAAPCPAQDGKKVKVTVLVILASDRCDYIDPRLKCIADEVRKEEPSLTGFSLAAIASQSVPANEKAIFPLVEGREMEVVVQKCADKNNRNCLAVTLPTRGEIVYRVVCGKFLPIATKLLTQEKVTPRMVAAAFGLAAGPRPAGACLAALGLAHGRTRDHILIAVCVQPCTAK